MQRSYNRSYDQLRPVRIVHNVFDYADGSVMLEIGKTRIVCAVSLAPGVPMFMKGKKQGWLTASYALLPMSTQNRVERESTGKRSDRSAEISRLIGRVLRSVVNMEVLGERTVYVDCDVLQADGGTRTACITGAGVALRLAEQRWLAHGLIAQPFLHDDVAAVSVGLLEGKALLDVDFSEDSIVEADFNFIMTKSGALIEIQGIAERHPIAWSSVEHMKNVAYKGITQLFHELSAYPVAPDALRIPESIKHINVF